MRHIQLMILRTTLAVVLLIAGLPATAAAPLGTQQPALAGTAVLVGLKPGASLRVSTQGVTASDSAVAQSVRALSVQSADAVFRVVSGSGQVSVAGIASPIDLRAVYRLRLPAGANVAAAVAALSAQPGVVYAEPDGIAHLITTIPNDPLYSQQWGLAQIGAPAAWDVVTGSTSVAIAVIDSGIDISHTDLIGQLWNNPGEIPGSGIDGDNDGHIGDIHGWNFLGDNADLSDNNGHGTEVAGIIAAATNNGTGVAGVCWTCKLMVVKVAQPSGVANYSDIAAGVNYAAQHGAKVINLSLGGNSDSITLRAAVTAAAATAVIVGGAGNDNSSALFYPAAYPNVLAVAGTTLTDTKTANSNFGPWVSVTAPGENITTTFSGGTYGASSGTSLAAAFVSGLAGLLFSQHSDWSPAQVRAQIVHTAHNIDAQNPSYAGQLGSGRIDAASAVTTVPSLLLQYVSFAANGQTNAALTAGATLTLAVTLHNDWAAAGSVSATLVSGDSHVTVTKPNANWGALGSDQSSANSADPFQVSVQAGAFGLNIPFTLNVLADGVPTTLHFTAATESVDQTIISPIASDATWTSDRIWLAATNVIVNTGVTLTIQPGTVVKFNTGMALLVNGTLIADGTPASPIRFTSNATNPAPGDWGISNYCAAGGIVFTSNSQPAQYDGNGNYLAGSIIRNAIIEYGQGIGICGAGPFIDHNLIQQNGGSGFGIEDYGGGPAKPVLSHNRIVSNKNVAVFIAGPAIVRQNVIADNQGGGIRLDQSLGTVISNTITGNGQFECGPGYRSTICFGPFSGNPSKLYNNNIFGNRGAYDVALFDGVGQVVTATNNYWGTTDPAAIRARVYDSSQDVNVGTLNTAPFLSQPEPSAPAFLSQLSLSPASPVGIQRVTFDLNFSAPMDQSLNPIVGFGAAQPYTTFAVLDNAQWITNSLWRATFDMTSLVPRGAYTMSVSGAQGVDGMEIPTDTRFGFTVDYAGQITDKTAPPTPWIFADSATGNAGYVTAHWTETAPNSTIIHYRYAIGSAPGLVDVVNWTLIDTTTFTRSGLGLVAGQRYWVSVQAQNQGGLWSAIAASELTAGAKNPRLYLPVIRH